MTKSVLNLTSDKIETSSFLKDGNNKEKFIKVKGLKKFYGQGNNRLEVLKGVDFEIEKSCICTLLGPSGSGKSTILNILGGIEDIDEGSVSVGSLSIEKLSKNKLSSYRREKLGFVFQFYNLVPNLTIRENIEVGAYLSENPLNIDEIIDELGLGGEINKFPNQVSGGQQQRTAIARALSKNPSILLCDEPTGALDYKTAKDVLGLIQKINNRYNTTIIIATHNTAISNMSHRTLKLHDGFVVENKVNEDVIQASELVW